jgi:hypothetical protein
MIAQGLLGMNRLRASILNFLQVLLYTTRVQSTVCKIQSAQVNRGQKTMLECAELVLSRKRKGVKQAAKSGSPKFVAHDLPTL